MKGLDHEEVIEYPARMEDPNQVAKLTVMGWPKIIAITLAAGLATGLVLGLVFGALGLPTAGIGVGMGVVEGLVVLSLLRKRQRALAARGEGGGQ